MFKCVEYVANILDVADNMFVVEEPEDNVTEGEMGEDETRAEMPFLIECIKAAEESGATCISVSDDNGEMMGDEMASFVSSVKKETKLPLSIKVSDKLSMGVSDALFALKAGADGIKCSITGNGALSTDDFASAIRAKGDKIGVRSSLKFTEIHSDIESLLNRICRCRNRLCDNNSPDTLHLPCMDVRFFSLSVPLPFSLVGYLSRTSRTFPLFRLE